MPYQRDYSFTIPNHLMEDFADEIARRVTTHLQRQIQPQAVQLPQPIREAEKSIQPTFLRLKEIRKRTGLSTATIYRKLNKGEFPASVALGARSVAWRRTDIELWETNPTGYSTPQ